MNPIRRPLAITVLSLLYIAVGAIGFVYHFRDSLAAPREGVWIELTEAAALLFGIFMLLGRNWARYGALAWMLLHVVLSYFDRFRGLAVHALLCILFGWLLFSSDSTRFFRRNAKSASG